jgi:heme-degrading monooxygenase HmoA
MELLVVTLAHIIAGTDVDILTHIRQMADTVRNATGLITSHLYRGREEDCYYFLLTTWEDMGSWQKAQEQHDARQYLLASTDLLRSPPEQWLMHYQWGYSRPAKVPSVFTIHITTLRPDQARLAQREWIAGLRKHAMKPTLAFAFLAQEIDRDATIPFRAVKPLLTETKAEEKFSYDQSTTLLSFLSWASEIEREAFYKDFDYLSLKKQLEGLAVTRLFPLELVL